MRGVPRIETKCEKGKWIAEVRNLRPHTTVFAYGATQQEAIASARKLMREIEGDRP